MHKAKSYERAHKAKSYENVLHTKYSLKILTKYHKSTVYKCLYCLIASVIWGPIKRIHWIGRWQVKCCGCFCWGVKNNILVEKHTLWAEHIHWQLWNFQLTQVLSIGDYTHINDQRFLVVKKPSDDVSSKTGLFSWSYSLTLGNEVLHFQLCKTSKSVSIRCFCYLWGNNGDVDDRSCYDDDDVDDVVDVEAANLKGLEACGPRDCCVWQWGIPVSGKTFLYWILSDNFLIFGYLTFISRPGKTFLYWILSDIFLFLDI